MGNPFQNLWAILEPYDKTIMSVGAFFDPQAAKQEALRALYAMYEGNEKDALYWTGKSGFGFMGEALSDDSIGVFFGAGAGYIWGKSLEKSVDDHAVTFDLSGLEGLSRREIRRAMKELDVPRVPHDIAAMADAAIRHYGADPELVAQAAREFTGNNHRGKQQTREDLLDNYRY